MPAAASPSTEELMRWERGRTWHPFTPMGEWCDPREEPLLLCRASGAVLEDVAGRRYLDGNSSIWTNLHGHRHPKIDAAIREQLGRFAHVSYLGAGHPAAAELAERLCAFFPPGTLERVFFSDDGSTAVEVAVKMAAQFWQQNGCPEKQRFAAFHSAYHGDTAGAASLGGIPLFHDRFSALHFPVLRVSTAQELEALPEMRGGKIAGVVLEPLVQGVNRVHLWPGGMLREVREICDKHGAFLILDEVLTGFGRTGSMFACQQEGVVPDFLCLAKGLTGGYLPLAATLTTGRVFRGFLGEWHEGRTFFYGHSYTANALGCAAALASLEIFREENTLEAIAEKARILRALLEELRDTSPFVPGFRQIGLIAGIDLCLASGESPPERARAGFRVCAAARAHGLLTRNIGDTVVLIPPYCTTEEQLGEMVGAVRLAAREILESLS